MDKLVGPFKFNVHTSLVIPNRFDYFANSSIFLTNVDIFSEHGLKLLNLQTYSSVPIEALREAASIFGSALGEGVGIPRESTKPYSQDFSSPNLEMIECIFKKHGVHFPRERFAESQNCSSYDFDGYTIGSAEFVTKIKGVSSNVEFRADFAILLGMSLQKFEELNGCCRRFSTFRRTSQVRALD